LIAFILLALCVVSVRTVWTLFLRDSAHGVVTGDVLQIMPPWRGELRSLEVEVGDTVRRGDVLAVICDPNLEIALSRARDELVLATAQRDAKIAELSVAAATRADQLQQQRAQYYRLQAELQAERAHRDELAGKLVRREQLLDAKAVSNDELESIRIRKRGAQQQIESLQQAAHELELRLQQVTHTATDDIQSRPSSARIDQLRNEIGRLEAQIQRQTLRSPVDAVVVHVDIHPGEYAGPERAVIELLEKDSQEFVLFVDQRQADKFAVGRRLQVSVEPDGRRVPCQVVRVGQRFDKPSVPLPGGQPPDQRRLPVWLRPEPGATGDRPVPLGSAVRLPVMWNLVSRGTIE
jgi:HlyD family secretion protein